MDIKAKLLTAAAMGLSTLVVSKALEAGWKLVTGEEPPREDDTGRVIQLMLFAGVSAMAIAGVQRLAVQQTNRYIASRF